MNLQRIALVSSFAIAAALGSAFSASDVTYWVGSGSNQAVFVVDYNDGINPHSYAWGYRWNGSATGADMLAAVDADDSGLNMTVLSFFGPYLDSSTYDANHDGTVDHTGATYPAGWWAYYTKDSDASAWTYASTGMADRALVNGNWDGWSYVVGTGWDSTAPTEPTAASQAVPEPMTLIGLGFGALGLAARRRRK